MEAGYESLKKSIATLAQRRDLSEREATAVFDGLMEGWASPTQIGALLIALSMKGETPAEISGAARAMRARMVSLEAPKGAIDVCGTGGDAKGTLNISSAVSFVAAAAGVPVAKHGNRAASSKSGAGDVLEALGVNCHADLSLVKRALWENGTCFLFAMNHHPAMRHVGPSRSELGLRTIFNLLGPLSNPCRVKRQLLGIYAQQWLEPMANALKNLGHEKAWVVHGAEGLDEVSVTGETFVSALEDDQLKNFSVTPADFGLESAPLDSIAGGNSAYNAKAMRAMLSGEDKGPYRTAVLMNTAAALIVAGKADDLKIATAMAAEAIDSGEALKRLDGLIQITNSQIIDSYSSLEETGLTEFSA